MIQSLQLGLIECVQVHLLLLIQDLAQIVGQFVSLGIIVLVCGIVIVLRFADVLLRLLTGINL